MLVDWKIYGAKGWFMRKVLVVQEISFIGLKYVFSRSSRVSNKGYFN